MCVTADSWYCGSGIKYITAVATHRCQANTNHNVLCTFRNKIFMFFALALLGKSDIRHRNDKLIENFWGDGSTCNSALVKVCSISCCGWLFKMMSSQVLRILYYPNSILCRTIFTLIHFRALYEYIFLTCL